MVKKVNDMIAELGADLGSPQVLSEIDRAIEVLLNLRMVAVQLHGEESSSPPARVAQLITKTNRVLTDLTKKEPAFDGTLGGLIKAYTSDEQSPFQQLQHSSKENYLRLMGRLNDVENLKIASISAREVLKLYDSWVGPENKISIGHALIRMFRSLLSFGATILEDPECKRLSDVLSKMRFKIPTPRTEQMTAGMANAIRAEAHKLKWDSIALAQAFQFELMLRQKDVIGEWVPLSDPTESDITDGDQKWVRGLRWEEIDDELVLRRKVYRPYREIVEPLKKWPMITDELKRLPRIPKSGPIVCYDKTGRPWSPAYFRQVWSQIADGAGVPKKVRNADSRNPGVDSHASEMIDEELELALELDEQASLAH